MLSRLLYPIFLVCFFGCVPAYADILTVRSSGMINGSYVDDPIFGPSTDSQRYLGQSYSITIQQELSPRGAQGPGNLFGIGPVQVDLTLGADSFRFADTSSLYQARVTDNTYDSAGAPVDIFYQHIWMSAPGSGMVLVIDHNLHVNNLVFGANPLHSTHVADSDIVYGRFNLYLVFAPYWDMGSSTLDELYATPTALSVSVSSPVPEPSQTSLLVAGLAALFTLALCKSRRIVTRTQGTRKMLFSQEPV